MSYNKATRDFNAIVVRLKRDNPTVLCRRLTSGILALVPQRRSGSKTVIDGRRRAGDKICRLTGPRRRHAFTFGPTPAKQADRQGHRRAFQAKNTDQEATCSHLRRDAGLVCRRGESQKPPTQEIMENDQGRELDTLICKRKFEAQGRHADLDFMEVYKGSQGQLIYAGNARRGRRT